MKKYIIILLVTLLSTSCVCLCSEKLLTVAEASDYKKTSTSADVMLFLKKLTEKSNDIRIETLLITNEGRRCPMVIIGNPLLTNPNQAKRDERLVVYIQANIHAGEVAGKEATMMLMREMLFGKLTHLPEKIIFIIVPNLNADGNDKISTDNRSYIPGPEGGVGTRFTSQGLDPNRDYIKLDTPEIAATIEKIYNVWDPLLTFDMHTTNGSFHKHFMTYASGQSPSIDPTLSDYTWNKLFPAIANASKGDGLFTLPYGNFKDALNPEEGWQAFPDTPRLSTCYVSFRARFSILCEAYAHIDFKTRVWASYVYLVNALEYIANHADEMKAVVKKAEAASASIATIPNNRRPKMPLEFEPVKSGTITIHSYEFEKRKEPNVYPRYKPHYEKEVTYTIPLMTKYTATRDRTYAAAYILPAGAKKVVKHLLKHGVHVEKIEEDFTAEYRKFHVEKLNTSKLPSQGHWRTFVKGEWKPEKGLISDGSYYVPMNQPPVRLISAMLEPDASDSLVSWNFFDSWLVPQWGRRLLPYPVLRLDELPKIYSTSVK